jgi:anti-sigma regulatory factor (Ser/Thr protein kinase)
MASPELRFCIPADAGRLEASRERVRLFLDANDVEEEAAHDVLLCVHEACANAIRHSGSTSGVDVELRLQEACVSIVVADRGLGLDIDLHHPHRKPELLQAGGRGLYVIACLMDELEVHIDGGTEIRMNKRFAPRRAVERRQWA